MSRRRKHHGKPRPAMPPPKRYTQHEELLFEATAYHFWQQDYRARETMIELIQMVVPNTKQTPFYHYDYYSRKNPHRAATKGISNVAPLRNYNPQK